jgi:transcriptional/translational regulatory protein YebC/TACO1
LPVIADFGAKLARCVSGQMRTGCFGKTAPMTAPVARRQQEKATMTQAFQLDGEDYNADALSDDGKAIYAQLQFIRQQLQLLSNQQMLLNKAKNAYIADLKIEIVQGRTGVNLAALFDDD